MVPAINPKFEASNRHLWLYSSACVGSGLQPRRQVFSRGSVILNHVGRARRLLVVITFSMNKVVFHTSFSNNLLLKIV